MSFVLSSRFSLFLASFATVAPLAWKLLVQQQQQNFHVHTLILVTQSPIPITQELNQKNLN
jgi:hypothetical protein